MLPLPVVTEDVAVIEPEAEAPEDEVEATAETVIELPPPADDAPVSSEADVEVVEAPLPEEAIAPEVVVAAEAEPIVLPAEVVPVAEELPAAAASDDEPEVVDEVVPAPVEDGDGDDDVAPETEKNTVPPVEPEPKG